MTRTEAKPIVADEVISNEMLPQCNVDNSFHNLANADWVHWRIKIIANLFYNKYKNSFAGLHAGDNTSVLVCEKQF